MLVRLARALSGHRSTLMDLLGHGQSGTINETSRLSDNALAAASVFQGPGLVFGHSFGGVTALRFALSHPDRVEALVLFEPVLMAAANGTASFAQNVKDFRPVVDGFESGDDVAAVRAFLRIWGDGTPWDDLPPMAQNYLADRAYTVRDTGDDLQNDATGILSAGNLENLTCPVLLIRGDESPDIVEDIQSALALRLPNASEAVLSGYGHMAPVQKPELIAQTILGWLGQK